MASHRAAGRVLYKKKTQQIRLTQIAKKAKANMSEVAMGDAVVVNLDEYIHDNEQLPSILLVVYLRYGVLLDSMCSELSTSQLLRPYLTVWIAKKV